MCPLPGEICPVYWSYDHVLYLYPLPDVIVVGDRFGGFTAENVECLVFNPVSFHLVHSLKFINQLEKGKKLKFQIISQGPFARNNFNFKVLIPSTCQVEDSEIGDT